LAFGLNLPNEVIRPATNLIIDVYRAFVECDCSLMEINPLAIVSGERGVEVLALDAKINFDDNALYRHEKIGTLRDKNEEDARELEAKESGLSYISLDGNIGCMVNGAGLAMATMDVIKLYGAEPANFLDVGGSATTEAVAHAFRLILSDPKVEAVMVNIFGGIMKCDTIANGIVEAIKQVNLTVPLVVRLEGTNVEMGRKILSESGLELMTADSLSDAAEKAVCAIGS
jgi:succinyl-CoA synthetase beta subunit